MYPSVLFLIPEGQETEPLGLWRPHLGSVDLMADFAVPGTSFPICYHFVTHTLTLFPSLSFPWEYTINKNLMVLKKKKECSAVDIAVAIYTLEMYVYKLDI